MDRHDRDSFSEQVAPIRREDDVRAVVLQEFGPPDRLVLQQVSDPVPGPGQVLVSVVFANLTFVETQIRAGRPPVAAMAPKLPVVLGNGVGGIVASVGAGADPALVGRRVVGSTGGSGGYAELVAVDVDELVEVPEKLELADAVALLADGRTAVGLMDFAQVGQEAANQEETGQGTASTAECVLIEAAAGGVGGLLLQLAVEAGATVVALAGGPQKVAHVRDLGAAIAVDYSEPGWAERVRTAAGRIDVVFDGVGGEIGSTTFGLLRDGGRFVSFGGASGALLAIPEDEATRRSISVLRGAIRGPQERRSLTRRALDLGSAGRLRPVIGQTFPLERAADAHAAMAGRATIGKTLLTVRAEAEGAR
jgi:NADPH:quinone reductase